tara:strand:+ start:141 stop:449 length:309 start_codon:yes stop_codon:yes gene_type:complete
MSAAPSKNNPLQVFIKTTTGSVFVKKRTNQPEEDTIGMCHKLVGQTLRPHLWKFVKKIPVYSQSDLDVLHSLAISEDLRLKAESYNEVVVDSDYALQDDLPL